MGPSGIGTPQNKIHPDAKMPCRRLLCFCMALSHPALFLRFIAVCFSNAVRAAYVSIYA